MQVRPPRLDRDGPAAMIICCRFMFRQREPRGARSPADGAGIGEEGGAAPTSPASDSLLLWIVRIGICLVPATPLVVGSGVIFPFVVGKAVFARSVIEITFACWAALVLFHPRRRPSRSWVIAAFAGWLLVSWVAGMLGVSPTRSLWSTYERMQGVFDLAHWFLFTLMAGSVFRTAADWRLLFGVNLAFGFAVCAGGLLHRYGLMDLGLPSDAHDRLGSTLGNPMYLGAYATVNALIGMAFFVQALGRPAGTALRRLRNAGAAGLWAVAAGVHLWAMWLSGTRSALAALVAALLVLAAYPVRGWETAGRVAGALAALILATVVSLVLTAPTTVLEPLVGSSAMWNRIQTEDDGPDPSLELRKHFAAAGLRAFLDRPVLGWGSQNFLIAWGRYHRTDAEFFGDHSHNKLVEELTTAGLLGLLSYLAVWTAMLSVVFRSLGRLSGCEQLHLYLIGAALVAYFVQSLFQVDTHVSLMQLSLMAAFAVSLETAGPIRESPRGAPAWALAATAGLVGALTIASLAHFNIRLYLAAAAAGGAMTPQRAWTDRLDDFTRSTRGFPRLANQSRRHFVGQATVELERLSEEDFLRTVDLVARETDRSAGVEPQNWLHETVLASFYQVAATRDARHLGAARRHIDRARELAPGIPQVVAVSDLQGRLEASVAPAPDVRETVESGGLAESPPAPDAATSTAPARP